MNYPEYSPKVTFGDAKTQVSRRGKINNIQNNINNIELLLDNLNNIDKILNSEQRCGILIMERRR